MGDDSITLSPFQSIITQIASTSEYWVSPTPKAVWFRQFLQKDLRRFCVGPVESMTEGGGLATLKLGEIYHVQRE